jgi:hypothetical protein
VLREPDLLEIVAALRASSGLAGCLHSRQQKRNQNCDDRDHDQQLDQSKP